MNKAVDLVKTLNPHATQPKHVTPPDLAGSQVKLVLTPLKPGVLATGGYVDILVEAFATEDTARKALPLNLAFVIDRSGSMGGKPLREAKACVSAMIARMKPDDRASIVAYDDAAEVIVPSMPVAELLPKLGVKLAQIVERGMTDLHGGWLAGAEQAAPGSGATTLSRVILLSDGQANKGLTAVDQIAKQAQQLADAGVTTSTYGLGLNFNEVLMTEIASMGNGSAYFGETADDLMPKFLAEFSALAATVGRNASIFTTPLAECINGYRQHGDGGYLIPNLVAGAASWALLRFSLPPLSGISHGISVNLAWQDEDGNRSTIEQRTSIMPMTPEEFELLEDDPKVAERLKELTAASIQTEARKAAEQNDWAKVTTSIANLRNIAGDNLYVAGIADTLQELAARKDRQLFSKEAVFATQSMSRGYSSLYLSDTGLDDSAPAFAMRSTRQGKATK